MCEYVYIHTVKVRLQDKCIHTRACKCTCKAPYHLIECGDNIWLATDLERSTLSFKSLIEEKEEEEEEEEKINK